MHVLPLAGSLQAPELLGVSGHGQLANWLPGTDDDAGLHAHVLAYCDSCYIYVCMYLVPCTDRSPARMVATTTNNGG